MTYLVPEHPDPAGTRCCPYCLRPVTWRYSNRWPAKFMGDPLCRSHGSLLDWYVVREGRITAVGHRRRGGRALIRPVPARTRPLLRQKAVLGHRGHRTLFSFTPASLARLPVLDTHDQLPA